MTKIKNCWNSSNLKKLLELYQFEECPYCRNVRTKLTDLGMSYIIHNVPRKRAERKALEKLTGQKFVPVLIDPNTGVMIVDDDEKAIKYLEERYKENLVTRFARNQSK